MENEKEVLNSESGEEMSDDSIDYIAAINEMKANSVDKAQYEKLKSENKKLMDALINNKQIETPKKREIDVDSIQKKLLERNPRMTSLEGFQLMLDLREADLQAGKTDPFISANMKSPTQADIEAAQRRADIYQECIDYAQGDPALFSQELTRRMVDPPITRPKNKNNNRRF